MLDGNNVGLISARSNKSQTQDQFFCTDSIVETKCGERTTQSYLFPLYLYPDPEKKDLFEKHEVRDTPGGRRPNLARAFIEDVSRKLGLCFVEDGTGDLRETFGPEDIFRYAYAVFHSPAYRARYAEFLKIDFPRLPLTANLALFRILCEKGEALVGLHLLETVGRGAFETRYPVPGDNEIAKGYPKYKAPGQPAPGTHSPAVPEGRIYINLKQYFDNVAPDVWTFYVGGYQVLDKWLKDRRGRCLTYDDLTHYQQIVVALRETIRLMEEIDDMIEQHGGWPLS